MRYDVAISFNGRLTGSGQKWECVIEAESLHDALDRVIAIIARDPRHGHSIYLTGCQIAEQRR